MPACKLLARGLLASLALFFATGLAVAREVWVVQFNTQFPDAIPPCRSLVRWQSHLMFRNTTDQALVVTFLGVSNGPARSDARPLIVPPRRTISLRGLEPSGPHWEPDLPPTLSLLWVNKLEVPDGVLVSSRAEAAIFELLTPSQTGPCDGNSYLSAGLPFRVVDRLVGAGVTQYHLGVDIGNFTVGGSSLDSRINVGVFNASATPATVGVKVLCSSQNGDDPEIVAVEMMVPPNSLAQRTILPSTTTAPCPLPDTPAPYHVIVTSDQPGFSYATSLLNGPLPKFPAFSSLTF
jgi:hypothetical protein